MRQRWTVEEYVDGVRAGDRRALARAITLVESRLSTDRALAAEVLQRLQPFAGGALRVGVSGVPGVGKSSFVEALGVGLVAAGRRLAVLAVDPSSTLSGGSILGDKTRMEQLTRLEQAYVRPSPGGDAVGGVARRTREAMLICEAAGFDTVFVETIGVGQSETAVAAMVDHLLLLVLTGAGDDLQGIKRGLLELADSIAVTKADGDNAARAGSAAEELRGALRILQATRAAGPAPVTTCSARTGAGLDDVWQAIEARTATDRESGRFAQRRAAQDLHWFDAAVDDLLHEHLAADPRWTAARARLRDAVGRGTAAPTAAARELIEVLDPSGSEPPAGT